jgi:hypothetical protein
MTLITLTIGPAAIGYTLSTFLFGFITVQVRSQVGPTGTSSAIWLKESIPDAYLFYEFWEGPTTP